jgi:hypothetical protein
MFSGSTDVTFESAKPPQEVVGQIKECLESLGRFSIDKSGQFEIGGTKFNGFGFKSKIDGTVRAKDGRYSVNVDWTAKPEIVAWLLAICLFPFGLAIFLLPYNAKSEIERKVEKALSALKFEVTGR